MIKPVLTGLERVSNPVSRRETMSYSIINREDKPSLLEPLTVKSVVALLIEKDVAAWKNLPNKIKDLFLSNPERFRFQTSMNNPNIPDIIYNKVVMSYINNAWVVSNIED